MLRIAICNSRAQASAIGRQVRWASSDKPAAGPKEAGKEANAAAGECCQLSSKRLHVQRQHANCGAILCLACRRRG